MKYQIFSLRNTIEQCAEWQRQLYINFIVFENAFDSNHGDNLWRILRAYGIRPQIINIIRNFYSTFTFRIDQSYLRFEVKTGVRQGCVMSAVLFNIVIDWVLRRTREDEPPRGIRWTLLFQSRRPGPRSPGTHPSPHPGEDKDNKAQSTFGQQVGLKISQQKNRSDDCWHPIPIPCEDWTVGTHPCGHLHLPGQQPQPGWGYRQGHAEPTEQNQECVHEHDGSLDSGSQAHTARKRSSQSTRAARCCPPVSTGQRVGV